MTASAKGTTQEPGRNVKQKAGLNRAILAKGWHGFKLACENRARRTGTKIVQVDPADTSQRRTGRAHRSFAASRAGTRTTPTSTRPGTHLNADGPTASYRGEPCRPAETSGVPCR
jgi:hypothetical protein